MKNKSLLNVFLITNLMACASLGYADSPKIVIYFSDSQGVCKNKEGFSQFAFNYTYSTHHNFEYYSGPINVNQSHQFISAPSPSTDVDYKYSTFAITDAGMCGDRDLNYENRGDCFNLSTLDQAYPYSYQVTIKPQEGPDQVYGKSYQLSCEINKF